MPGYALLPTLAEPVSHLSLRLSSEEMKERNEWIVGAAAHGLSHEEIALDVGLSVQRVYQIIKPSRSQRPKAAKQPKSTKFKTPRDAAVAEFMADNYHIMGGGGVCKHFDHTCMHCVSSLMMVESEYDSDGWPYSWAMYGQEKYIEACS